MNGVRWAAAGLLVVALSGVSRADDPPPAAPEPGVHVLETSSGTARIDVVLTGRLLGYALPRNEDGSREIHVLVLPREQPPAPPSETDDEADDDDAPPPLPPCPPPGDSPRRALLYRIDTTPRARLVPLEVHLTEDCALDALDVDGDGRDELLALCDDGLTRIDRVAPVRAVRLLDARGSRWLVSHPRAVGRPDLQDVALVPRFEAGRVSWFGPSPDSERWTEVASAALPSTGSALARNLRLQSPGVEFVGRDGQGRLVWATSPEQVGKRRLRILRIDIGDDGVARTTESWARLPGNEWLMEHAFVMLDGAPVLLVTTRPADKLSLFGEKTVRIYPVERDRSRRGLAPLYATRSRMNLWQDASVRWIDVDADGDEDLVFAYWKGMKDSRVVLDAYLRVPEGLFENEPQTTGMDIEKGDRSFALYGHDVDADGRPDLLVRDGGELLLFPGSASSSGKKLVRKEPLRFPLDDGDHEPGETSVVVSSDGATSWVASRGGWPEIVDLDGAGPLAVLIIEPATEHGLGVIRVCRWDP